MGTKTVIAYLHMIGPAPLAEMKDFEKAVNAKLVELEDCFVNDVRVLLTSNNELIATIFYKETQ